MSKIFILPASSDQHIYRGDTISIDASISQGGIAVNLTDYEVWFTAKPNIENGDGDPGVIQKTVNTGIDIIDTVNGKIRITIDPEDTEIINQETTYQCDLQIKDSDGRVSTAAKGTLKIELDVTQSTT